MKSTNRLNSWIWFLAMAFTVLAFTLATRPAMAHDPEIPTYIQTRLQDVIKHAERHGDVQLINPLNLNSIMALLEHKNHSVASAAAYALGEIRNPAAVPHLISALESDRAHMRRIVAHALGRIGDKHAVKPLIEMLGSGTQPLAVQTSVIMSLGKIGDPEATWILNQLNYSSRNWLRKTAKVALLKINALQSFRIAVAE